MKNFSERAFALKEDIITSIQKVTKDAPLFFNVENAPYWKSFITGNITGLPITRIAFTGIYVDDEFYAYSSMCLDELVQVTDAIQEKQNND